jgi:hypothetical protein
MIPSSRGPRFPAVRRWGGRVVPFIAVACQLHLYARVTPPTGFARSQRPQPDPLERWDAAVLDVLAANLLV